ncbi:hypothetical protein FACS1894217_12530 [Clostridia bacterium]|nr:hypothetical protein FACS1894217_12530 [Clostridia bacterium]
MDVKQTAIELFNGTWDLIDLPQRTAEQDAEMLTKAHTSSYLWGLVEDAKPVNRARGLWQISHVYSLLKQADAALLYGDLSLGVCDENEIGGLDLAFGYEAVARGWAVKGDTAKAEDFKAKGLAVEIADENDRKYVQGELNGFA